MRVLELFAGAGGAALGLERAGIEHAALVEWDRDAAATLRAAGLGPVVEGDVRDLDRIEAVAGRVDAVWSSFPCQAWSTAGKREGATDGRNGWPWSVAAIDRFRPRWFLGENVVGLTCHRGGCTNRGGQEGLFTAADPMKCPGCYFERVILPELRARFPVAGYWELDSADYSIPQHRRRIFLWAGPVEPSRPRETHGPGRALPWVSMGEALGLTEREEGATTRGGFGEERDELSIDGPSTAVTCQLAKQANPWKSTGLPYVRAVGAGTNPHGPGRAHERTERDITDEPAPTVTAEQVGNAGPWIEVVNPYLSKPSPTVSAVSECKGSGPGGLPEKMQRASDALFLGTGRRRLTVEECAKLQGFPDDHPWQGSKSSRYKQVGNAVVPLMAEVVGRAILETDRGGR